MPDHPKILVVGSTHGHERIGLKVIDELRKLNIDREFLDFEIGNPKASELNIPFVESDLNRIFPGKENGTYEEVRAYELLSKIKSADLVIDIHSTNTTDLSDKSMLIVTKYDDATKSIVKVVKPPKVLYMKYRGDNALISNANIGIAFEYGKDISEEVLNATLYDIAEVLRHCKLISVNPYATKKINLDTEAFEVYDVFKKDFEGSYLLSKEIRNFQTINKGSVVCTTDGGKQILAEEDFIPILFGENRYTEILGFKAKRI